MQPLVFVEFQIAAGHLANWRICTTNGDISSSEMELLQSKAAEVFVCDLVRAIAIVERDVISRELQTVNDADRDELELRAADLEAVLAEDDDNEDEDNEDDSKREADHSRRSLRSLQPRSVSGCSPFST